MRLISRTVCTFFITLLAGVQASALGLGDIQLNSKIGFPLDAYLPITGAEKFNPGELQIQLAGNDVYDDAGAYRSQFLTRVTFTILDRGKYGKLVRVQTEQPILEPNVDLIVQADSDDGTILRHYSLIVDFP